MATQNEKRQEAIGLLQEWGGQDPVNLLVQVYERTGDESTTYAAVTREPVEGGPDVYKAWLLDEDEGYSLEGRFESLDDAVAFIPGEVSALEDEA